MTALTISARRGGLIAANTRPTSANAASANATTSLTVIGAVHPCTCTQRSVRHTDPHVMSASDRSSHDEANQAAEPKQTMLAATRLTRARVTAEG